MSLAIKSITNTQTETNKKLKVLNESTFLSNAVEGTYVFNTTYSYTGGVDTFVYNITYPDNTTYFHVSRVENPFEGDDGYCSEYAKYAVGVSSAGYAGTYADTMTVVVGEDFTAQTVLTSNQHYHDIANAIREKNGESTTYLPSEMAEAISDLPDEPVLQSKSVTISSNTTQTITPDNNYDGLSSVNVTTNVQPSLQSKSVTISQNGTTNVSADNGYDGLSGVSITTNVSSGGDIIEKDVNFYDYDGTLLYSYTKTEFLALSAMPNNPSHTGLTAQGWNWTFDGAKTYVNNYGSLDVGQSYVTNDGKTRIYIHLEKGRLSPYLGFAVNGSVIVNWGDGNSETVTGSSTSAVVSTQHNYSSEGDYVITLESSSTIYLLGTSSSGSQLLWNNLSSGSSSNVTYQNAINKIELGTNIEIGRYALYQCYSLLTVNIPNNITGIEYSSFNSCHSLKCLILPYGFLTLMQHALSNCSSIKKVILPLKKSYFSIDGIVTGSYAMQSITVPDGVGNPGSSTFGYNRALKKIILPNGFAPLNGYIFQNCTSLIRLKIPSSYKNIHSYDFSGCCSMAYYDFTSLSVVPSLANTNAFSGIPNDCKIIVKDSLYNDWIAATNWSTYASYIIKESDWNA